MDTSGASGAAATTPSSPPLQSVLERIPRALPAAAGGATLLVLTTVAVAALVTPPAPHTPSEPGAGEWVGVLHVHTVASDGGGTVEDVAEAARDQGLDFVLLTDHNRWGADAWSYRDGPLVVVGEEVSTPYGHLLVAGGLRVGDRGDGLRAAATRGPDRLPVVVDPGEGLRIVAHPDTRPRWTAWDEGHFDGIEIWNADSERKNDGPWDWVHALALLPLRPMRAFLRLHDYPAPTLARWDRLLERGPVVGVCSVDAHQRLGLPLWDLPFPTYRQAFGLARQHVLLEEEPTGDPEVDGQALLEAIRAGRSYCGFALVSDPRGLVVEVRSGKERAGLGDTLPWRPGARITVALPAGGAEAEIRLIRDGEEAARGQGRRWQAQLPGPGVYRLEAFLPGWRERPLPWILTNPIRLEAPAASE